jgi:hypothetical protein
MLSIQDINRKPMLTDMAICNVNMDELSTEKNNTFIISQYSKWRPVEVDAEYFYILKFSKKKGSQHGRRFHFMIYILFKLRLN